MLSQTTQSLELFHRIGSCIEERMHDKTALTVNDTICRQVSSREQHLRDFAAEYDVVVFVCGRKSSNGRVLFEVCRAAIPVRIMSRERRVAEGMVRRCAECRRLRGYIYSEMAYGADCGCRKRLVQVVFEHFSFAFWKHFHYHSHHRKSSVVAKFKVRKTLPLLIRIVGFA